ncbi:MAG: VWA domain-containing protein [Lachnospiraceae bacterium]|nr:VWA domain-containing protein [Lachnospiraceae bacterium]
MLLLSACGGNKEGAVPEGWAAAPEAGLAGDAAWEEAPAEEGSQQQASAEELSAATEALADGAEGAFPGLAKDAAAELSAQRLYEGYGEGGTAHWGFDTEEYNALEESGFRMVSVNPLSTFSADVDTASYSNVRRMISDGYGVEEIPEGAVRIEEMLNYFSYEYAAPKKGEPFGVTVHIADCPWNENGKLMQLGLQTEALNLSEAPESNLVFLIDVSGSMDSEDKLGLLQRAFLLLTEQLTAKDRVSIITYAGDERVVLEGARGDEKEEIAAAVEGLFASGSTNGSAAILRAYELAGEYYIKGGNNRIILATDGDLNVGITDESSLKELVEEKRQEGIFLSVMGFGTGNIKDNKMETLADNGNGNYTYIDSYGEAKKVLVEELGANFVTVAKDVKFQVEFNPAAVTAYRLLGYENRSLAEEDFADDKKDAGEIGAGHSVTVLYELITADSDGEPPIRELPGLKYGSGEVVEEIVTKEDVMKEEWLTISVRYKEPEEDSSKLLSYPVSGSSYRKKMHEDMRFAAAVAEFGMVIRDSEYKGSSSFDSILKLLEECDLSGDEYKEEFYYLVKKLMRNS